EIRNLQICGNDIEYNFDPRAASSADVFFDCREGTVREGTLVGNTIQALQSRGGANVRFLGAGRDNPNAVGMFAITGNLIGSQHTHEPSAPVEASVEVRGCQNVSLTGCQIVGARGRGVAVHGSSAVRVADCTVRGRPDDNGYRAAVTVDRASTQVMVVNNFLAR